MESSSCRSVHLPLELLSEVLTRLPVKSLLRFKCVSKFWVDLINTPYFISSHLHNYSKRRRRINIIQLRLQRRYNNDGCFRTLHLDSAGNQYTAEARNLTVPLYDPGDENHYVFVAGTGTCNGLLCLWLPEEPLVFWNPSTHQYRHGPILECSTNCGFGYDQNSQDYKFATMIYTIPIKFRYTCKMYSLKSGSWCYQHVFDSDSIPVGTAFVCNGAVYWAFTKGVPFEYSYRDSWRLDCLDNSLCGLFRVGEQFDVWMRKNDDWSKLFSINQSVNACSGTMSVKLLAYAEDGRKVLISKSWALHWYDIQEKTLHKIDVVHAADSTKLSESLVPL
ncbi:F-box protein CPR1 [Sesamum alatum]|uniref:F-box protein CPR1 n=1 Tax=Sesamum alatum TaxID=300844 RepID=A0AAE2CKX5_9LAMI|nr:F-box protein CPR1 [Sesamum alatum]